MIKFSLSAFADEINLNTEEQIKWLKKNNFKYIELRGINDKKNTELDDDEVIELKRKFEENNLAVSCVGSPIGKINITDDFEPHKALCHKMCKMAKTLGTNKVRVFSFFMPEGANPGDYRDEVISRMKALCDIAKEYKVTLCHENEKNIYGDTAERCLDLYNALGGEMKCVFDHANFIACDVEPYPYAFNMLSHTLSHMHIKDANTEKEMLPAGQGIGRIPETIASLAKIYDGEFILTLEPHLMTFKGLKELESEGHTSKLGNRYKSPEDAFDTALSALKNIINNLEK